MILASVEAWHRKAKELLPQPVYDYYASGAMSEYTLTLNSLAFRSFLIIPRILVPVDRISISIEPQTMSHKLKGFGLLSKGLSSPIAVAPTALQKMAHPEGEIASFRAAKKQGQLAILSSWSSTSLQDIKSQVGASERWFQIYVYRDRRGVEKLIRRVEAAGFSALVVTVDTPVLGNRERDLENQFKWPEHITLANMQDFTTLTSVKGDEERVDLKSGLAFEVAKQIDPQLTWADIKWLSSITNLPIILKGIVTVEDCFLAIEKIPRLAGIIISNHGGRQLVSIIL